MKIINIKQEDYQTYFFEMVRFCQQAVREAKTHHTRLNMTVNHWPRVPECLFYKFFKVKSFILLTLIYDNNNLIALGGIEKYNSEIVSIAKRLFILREYRNQSIIHDYIIKNQLKWAETEGYKAAIVTFNEYKSSLYSFLERLKENKSTHFKRQIPSVDIYKKFQLLGKHHINNCDQLVAGITFDGSKLEL